MVATSVEAEPGAWCMSQGERTGQGRRGSTITGLATVAAVALALVVLAGCGGGESSAPATTSAAPTTTTTSEPVDHRSAMVARLTDEWGDRAVAEAVIAGIGDDALASWEEKVPLGEVATTPLLSYRPATTAADDIDSVVVFAFGNREGADGMLEPGPVNQALADATAAFVADHPVPVHAQWEVARFLDPDTGVAVSSIEPATGADGTVVYLSTRGVADAAVAEAEASATPLGTVGVICFADHLGRCLITARAAGMEAVAVEGIELPTTYDPESAQPWTRDRVSYLTTDLSARLAL